MSKTFLLLHNIEKDFYKFVQILWETFTTTQRLKKPARHVTTSDGSWAIFTSYEALIVETWDGWLIAVKRTKFLSCKINWYFMVIYILRIYCFFKNLFTHFPNSTKNFCSFLRIFQIITCPTSHRKDRVVNVCKHKFACTNVTPKRRNGAHFITHAPYCPWVIISNRYVQFSFSRF